MSYYQGDFYQGDPGFLSGLGKMFGAAASFIPGVGGLVSRGVTALTRLKGSRVGTMIAQHPTISAAGSAGLLGAGAGMITRPGIRRMGPGSAVMAPGGPMQRGFHMSKKAPFHMVRNRRMRVTNPKALRRAIRRAHGFARLARKVMSFTSPRGVKGRAHFRVRRRAAARR